MSFSRAWSHGLWTEYGSMVTYNQCGWLWMGSPAPRIQWWCQTWRPPKRHRWWAKTLSFLLVSFRLVRILIVEWQSVQHGCNTLSSAMAQLSSDSSLEWFVSFTKCYSYWYTFFSRPLRGHLLHVASCLVPFWHEEGHLLHFPTPHYVWNNMCLWTWFKWPTMSVLTNQKKVDMSDMTESK